MTLGEYLAYAEGRARQHEFDLNNARLIMTAIYQVNAKKRSKIKPSDVFPLSMDNIKRDLLPNVPEDEYLKRKKKLERRWQLNKN